jgi:hypothetical protein
LISALRSRGASFGDLCGSFPAGCDLVTDIQGTVARPESIEIRIPVITRADNIEILLLFTGRKPARAGTVPVALLIFQKTGNKIFCELGIRVQLVTSIFCLFLQDMVDGYYILRLDLNESHLPEYLPYFLLFETDNGFFIIDKEGGKRARRVDALDRIHCFILLLSFKEIDIRVIEFDTQLTQKFLCLIAPPAGAQCITVLFFFPLTCSMPIKNTPVHYREMAVNSI